MILNIRNLEKDIFVFKRYKSISITKPIIPDIINATGISVVGYVFKNNACIPILNAPLKIPNKIA